MLPIRIYYEDTDCGGVVYYANYLRFFERGRTEFFRELGISLPGFHAGGISFVVTKASVEYYAPAGYDDLLLLDTKLSDMTNVTMTFTHSVRKEGAEREIVKGSTVLAAVNRRGRAVRLPPDLVHVLNNRQSTGGKS